jgi:nucleoside-diphosphate-sugar epimerase
MKEMVQTVAAAVGVPAPVLRVPYAPVWLLASAIETVCRMVRVEPPLYRRQLAFFGINRAYCTDKIRAVLAISPRIEWDQGARRLADWYQDEGLL